MLFRDDLGADLGLALRECCEVIAVGSERLPPGVDQALTRKHDRGNVGFAQRKRLLNQADVFVDGRENFGRMYGDSLGVRVDA